MTMIAFPPFTIRTVEDVPPDVQNRRKDFAAGPLANRMVAKDDDFTQYADLLSPDIWGREMFRLHGKAWPQMIALASGAAMQAERDAMGEVE